VRSSSSSIVPQFTSMKISILFLSIMVLSSCSKSAFTIEDDGEAYIDDGGTYIAGILREKQDPNYAFTDAELAGAIAQRAEDKLMTQRRCSVVSDLSDRLALANGAVVADGEITFCGAPAVGEVSAKYRPPYCMSTYCAVHKDDATEVLKQRVERLDKLSRTTTEVPWDPVFKDL